MPLEQDTRMQLIKTLDRFVRERLIPLEAQVEANDEIPADVIEEMKVVYSIWIASIFVNDTISI